ncbi:MAG: phage virion morphogenesis protein [Alphaproteobacteria bacterium]|nr:phage virion morphogenesis protein [Alphaproteobacteria bacterium]
MAGVRLELDAKGAASALRDLVKRSRNPRPAFDQVGRILRQHVVERFEHEEGPNRQPWKKSLRAKRQRGQTLTDTGRLRKSITWNRLPDGVEVGTNVVYAAIHQFGGKTKPRIIRPKRAKALAFRVGNVAGGRGVLRFASKVRHPGSRIPARPFLGIDDRDRRAIRRIIDRHLLRGL